MGLKETIAGKMVLLFAEAADKKLDLRKEAHKLDELTDLKFGEKASERIQRGPLTNMALEFLEGLWAEDLNGLRSYLQQRYSQDAQA